MKILCLHGLRQNKEILKKSMSKIIKKLEKENIVFEFVESPYEFSNEGNYKQWRTANKENALTIENYDTINESIEFITKIWNDNEYDGILGFSQGSVVCQIFLYQIENEKIKVNRLPKYGLLCCSSIISDKELMKLYECPLKTRTIIINGEKDPLINLDMTNKLAKYLNSELYIHKGGHYICDKNNSIDLIKEFILKLDT